MTTMVISKTKTNIKVTPYHDMHCVKFLGHLVKYPGTHKLTKSGQQMTFGGHKYEHSGHLGSGSLPNLTTTMRCCVIKIGTPRSFSLVTSAIRSIFSKFYLMVTFFLMVIKMTRMVIESHDLGSIWQTFRGIFGQNLGVLGQRVWSGSKKFNNCGGWGTVPQ